MSLCTESTMPLDFNIEDEKLNGFNNQAKEKLREVINEFIDEILSTANRIEQNTKATKGQPEINSTIITTARTMLRAGLHKRVSWLTYLIRILASVLPFAVGMIYDSTWLQNATNMLIFVGLITLTITFMTLSVIRGN